MPSQFFEVHPKDPQPRLIRQAAEIIRQGGIVVYPTDSCYALGCHIGDKAAMERIARLRETDKHHNFTLVCSDLSEIATYARVSNQQYRTLKAFTPGPYTFILAATRETPSGCRIPSAAPSASGSRTTRCRRCCSMS
jgi:tRNA threonylcarbamoyl adenosine modification protein (Sua5/YciO/YrdC/YwlC family)